MDPSPPIRPLAPSPRNSRCFPGSPRRHGPRSGGLRTTMMNKTLALASLILLPTFAGCAPMESTDDENADSDSEAIKVCAKGATVKGVDVSKWQGHIDWAKVKAAGIGFAVVRVG